MPEKLNIATSIAALVALVGLSACDNNSIRRDDQRNVAYRTAYSTQADAGCYEDNRHERHDGDDGDDGYEGNDDNCGPSQSRPALSAPQAQATPPNNGLFVSR